MANPGGHYPGRQIFLGRVKSGEPAFAYFVSGRSPPSKMRKASDFLPGENAIRINPVDPSEPHDPFRHYQAVRIDPKSGLLVVSNSQAPNDAYFEACTFREENVSSYLTKLLSAIGPEYDNTDNPTPRIVGSIRPKDDSNVLGIVTYKVVTSFPFETEPRRFKWVQTYDGNVDYKSFDPFALEKTVFDTEAATARDLAEEIYGMSGYNDPTHGELRVLCLAGVRTGTEGPGGWDLFSKNRHSRLMEL